MHRLYAASAPRGFDGLQAVLIAEAAKRSWRSGKFEKVEQVSV